MFDHIFENVKNCIISCWFTKYKYSLFHLFLYVLAIVVINIFMEYFLYKPSIEQDKKNIFLPFIFFKDTVKKCIIFVKETLKKFIINVKENKNKQKVYKSNNCVICFEKQSGLMTLLEPCAHMCICDKCYLGYLRKTKKCPLCRKKIVSITIYARFTSVFILLRGLKQRYWNTPTYGTSRKITFTW